MGDRIEALAKGFLATLNRVPDDIILETAARDIDLRDGRSCVCAWALRERMGRLAMTDGENIEAPILVPNRCVEHFGGGIDEWEGLFFGAAGHDGFRYDADFAPAVELAFTDRVTAATGAAHVR